MRSQAVLVALLVAAGSLAATAAAEPSPIVVFEDQHTSGRIVLVDVAQLPEGGFVVAHEPADDEDGLGDVVGSSILLGEGRHDWVPVVLHDNVTTPRTLIAALWQDTNGNQVLDAPGSGDHHDHDHDHDVESGADETYTHGNLTIGDAARVQPYDAQKEPAEPNVDPLLVGTLTAIAALALWAVRYR